MCFLLVRYVDLIMQCTKQHFNNQIVVYYEDIKLQSYTASLRQASVMSNRALKKFYSRG